MLKLIDYNSERIVVVYTDCSPTLDKSRVQSVVLQTGGDSSCGILPNNIITYQQQEGIELLSGQSKIIEYYNLKQEVPNNFNLVINTTGLYSIEFSAIGSNVVEGNQILNDFKDTDLIIISGKQYTIDKSRSTKNKLILYTPLTSTSSTYLIPIVSKEILFPLEFFKSKAINYITSIKDVCCSNEIDKGTDFAFKFLALQQAIKCNNQEEALTLFNYLIAWT